MRVAVIGAGHAGLEAAASAAEGGAAVVLFGNESCLPYYRPRLTALAFAQADEASMFIRTADWYAARGIEVRPAAPVSELNARERAVRAQGPAESFDAIVLCLGARPVRPPSFATAGLAVFALWNLAHAQAIRARLRAGEVLAVIGGGILGLEAALRAQAAGLRVSVVEKAAQLMPAQFGARASRALRRRVEAKGIQVLTGRIVTQFEPDGEGRAVLRLDDGTRIGPGLCLLSIGAVPASDLARAAGLETDRGVRVNAALQTSAPFVFAAGDVAQIDGLTRCSVREAVSQGRLAGRNAVAAVRGEPLEEYAPQTLPLMFKSGDFELYAVGPPGGGPDYEEHLLEGSSEEVLRALIRKDGRLCGVQMIGTRHEFDDYLRQLHG